MADQLIKCIAVTLSPWDESNDHASCDVSVHDVDGTDITDHLQEFSLVVPSVGSRFTYAELVLDLPGYDGRFGTPVVIQK